MLAMALALCWLPGPQDSGVVGKFAWPPTSGPPAVYRVKLSKRRDVDAKLSKAEREARRDAGLHSPRRAPKQSVALTIDARIEQGDGRLDCSYGVRLDKQSLRVEIADAKSDEKTATPEPAAFAGVWGTPASPRAKPLLVPRSAFEREFAHAFPRAGPAPPRLGPIPGGVDAHLLPVLWETPLPCWVGHVVSIVDLTGVPVVDGKSMIQERTDFTALGSRTSRAEVKFSKASTSGFKLHYELRVDQRVDRTPDAKRPEPVPFLWRFDVEGTATYSFERQSFDKVLEQVTGRVVDPTPEKLCALSHEPFTGEIKVERITAEKPKKKGRKRGRRR